MTDGPRPRSGGSQRGPQPDPVRRPAPGVTDLRDRHQSGYGSPEGVVYAGAGVLYQDIDPAGAGAIWKKTTPGGNTGWVELGAGAGAGGAHAIVLPEYAAGSDGWVTDPGTPGSQWLTMNAGLLSEVGGWTLEDPLGTGHKTSLVPPGPGFYIFGWSGATYGGAGDAFLCVVSDIGGITWATNGGADMGDSWNTRGSSFGVPMQQEIWIGSDTAAYHGFGVNFDGSPPTGHNFSHGIWAAQVA